jgi:lipoate-protein ligase A
MWRRITEDGVSATFGLAADEFMADRQGGVATLRLYTYASHCVLLGRHQNLETEVNLVECNLKEVSVCRRPTGGGTILMGAEQLGVALTIPSEKRNDFPESSRELYPILAGGIIDGLSTFGVNATFHRKNDLEVCGRKISGLGIYMAPSGGLLFHASVLVDLDVFLVLRLLRTPFKKISDRALDTVVDRITTLKREATPEMTVGAAREAVAQGYECRFGVHLSEEPWRTSELQAIRALEADKYATEGWVSPPMCQRSMMVTGRKKTSCGLLEVHLQVEAGRIRQCLITGDFFAQEAQVRELEKWIRGIPVSNTELSAALNAFWQRQGGLIEGITKDELLSAFGRAARDAERESASLSSHACFVNP